ncbi:hypothetical protein GSUET_33050 [Geobacter sulfurreducens subsp. ethanolicus]|uniref:type VI secretion system tip protein TssI/VgrG n=1 Tax=Geobacter sulfurreducens TaxID=35554 RepID=UPI0025728014|nr:type VI secretion system tip protein TssI/VgrG [Geobacter sulfurreducens]BEH11693.1 hypothetical protein GSUET_33050 [Geobacter sulfurreducens subsp. ethanolicus]
MTIQKAAASLLSQGSTSSFQFEIPATRHLLSVAGFTVDERISHPYDIHLTLATQYNVALDEVIDKEAVLSVDHEGGTRYFHSVVREFTSLGTDGDYDLYHAHIVPALWFLSLEQDCRVFQFKNVQDVVAEILEESNITSDRYRFALSREDRLRKFCVQYRKTDLNFVSRLLEEEGIFYFFEHYEDKHVIVFSDTNSGYLYMPGKRQIPFNTNNGMVPGKESVFYFIYVTAMMLRHEAKQIVMRFMLSLLFATFGANGIVLAQTATYRTKGSIDCGSNKAVIISNCLDIGTNFPMCIEQKISITNITTNKSITVMTSSISYNDEALTGHKGGKLLDGLAVSWQCAKDKEENELLLLNFTNGGNCKSCEWDEIYDMSGRVVVSTKGKKNKLKFDRTTQKLKVQTFGDKKDIPLTKQ